jgi:hypothetical protein
VLASIGSQNVSSYVFWVSYELGLLSYFLNWLQSRFFWFRYLIVFSCFVTYPNSKRYIILIPKGICLCPMVIKASEGYVSLVLEKRHSLVRHTSTTLQSFSGSNESLIFYTSLKFFC